MSHHTMDHVINIDINKVAHDFFGKEPCWVIWILNIYNWSKSKIGIDSTFDRASVLFNILFMHGWKFHLVTFSCYSTKLPTGYSAHLCAFGAQVQLFQL